VQECHLAVSAACLTNVAAAAMEV
jgi:hypothetical protein